MSVLTACPHCDAPADSKAGICPGCHRPADERSAKLDKALKEVLGDRFELVCRVGSGACGEVFRARDTALDRDVALKQVRLDTFHDADEAEEMKQRVIREAKMAAKLLHPNIVTVHDVVQMVDSTLIIMEFVDGVTLESRLVERRRLSFDETLALMSQTAAALDHAHQYGIVHRDIKPANLMIDRHGRIRITDFGIAKTQTGTNITATGSVLGTPHYMSPEQARGETQLDGRADLFSLGCVMYECLAGQKPFRGKAVVEILLQIVNGVPAELDCDALQLHRDVQTVLNKALAKEAAKRFASANEFIEALTAIPATESADETMNLAGNGAPAEVASPLVTSRPAGSSTLFEIGLQGTLADKSIAEVIRDIRGNGKPGILHVQKRDLSKRLYFLDRSIVFANSDVESDRLGQFLIRGGVIDRSIYDHAWRAMKKTGRRFGTTLVELGNLDREKMNSLINKQIEEIIFSVFRWDAGLYSFETIDKPVEEDIILELSTEEIILKGSRRMASDDAIRNSIGSMDRIAQHASGSLVDDGKVALTSSEGFVLSCVDGSTSVADLVAIASIGENETLRCVYVLLTTGILKLEEPTMKATTTRVRGTDRPKVSPPPVAEVRNEDAPAENEKPSSGPSAEEEALLVDVTGKTSTVGKVSHYELLEVPRGGTAAEIKSAYFAMVKKFHPDLHQSQPLLGEVQPQLEALLIQFKAAYDVLFDPAQRMKYDKHLAPLPPPSKPAAPPAEGLASALESSSTAAVARGAAFVLPTAYASPHAMAQARYQAGKAHFEEKDYHEAVESLREAVRLAPETPDYHHLLARALVKNPKWRKQAEKHFTCVIELEPFRTAAYVELAQLYEEGGLATRAKKMYEKVLELNPDHEIAVSKLNVNSNPVEQLIAKPGFLQRFQGKGHREGTTGDAEAESRARR